MLRNLLFTSILAWYGPGFGLDIARVRSPKCAAGWQRLRARALDVAAVRNGMDGIYAVLPATFAPERKILLAALKGRLPAYMLPLCLFFRDEIPVNGNGKMDWPVLKVELMAEAVGAP